VFISYTLTDNQYNPHNLKTDSYSFFYDLQDTTNNGTTWGMDSFGLLEVDTTTQAEPCDNCLINNKNIFFQNIKCMNRSKRVKIF